MGNLGLHKQILRIRLFEETVLKMFDRGLLSGTTHTYIGQEANAVGVLSHLNNKDFVFSSHRSHGHFLAHGGSMEGLFRELMGRFDGICAGRGGSQHIITDNFMSSGIQGGYAPLALGFAYAEKIKKSRQIVVAFIGDGTLGQGTVYETLNMLSLYQVPLLIVIENNKYAQTTPIEKNFAGTIVDRVKAFGVDCDEVDSSCVSEIYTKYSNIIKEVREECKPFVGIIHTERLMAHSKGDDPRDAEYIRKIWDTRDPLTYIQNKISADDADNNRDIVEKEIGDILDTLKVDLK